MLLVTFDTTRADHMEVYGGPAATPHSNRLADEGWVFEQAYSPVPITLPSHSTIMTGKVPFAHGVRDNGLFELGAEQETLAELLRDAGYVTAASVGSFPVTSKFGIDQGFELFDENLNASFEDFFGNRVVEKRHLHFDERPAGQVNEPLMSWLEDLDGQPFFAWAHYFDPHFPHTPPAPYNQLYAHDLYAGEIAYADASLGALLDLLRQRGLYDDTIVVVTADHGEGRGEHNESTHSLLAYNSTLHVPLIVKPPAAFLERAPAGSRFSTRVGLVDIMPSILHWLGLEAPEGIQGQPLDAVAVSGSTPAKDRVIYAETLSPRISQGWGELRALFVDDLKYIHGPRPELFDLVDDPKELHDLTAERPEDRDRLKRNLQSYLDRHAVPGLDASIEGDEETTRRLMALGYVQPSGVDVGPIAEELSEDGDPPQDRAITISMYSQAKQLLYEERWLDALEHLERLLRLDPDNGHYIELIADAEARLGRIDQALRRLRSIPSDAFVPTRGDVLTTIGTLLLHKGDMRGALEHFRDAQLLRRTAAGQYQIAQLYQAEGDDTQAVTHLEAALELDPAFLPARLVLAVVDARRGNPEAAESGFQRALSDHPLFPYGHFNYAVFLLSRARREEALEHLRRAVVLAPDYHQARAALTALLVELEQEDEALDHYLELAGRAPSSRFTDEAARVLELDL
ncbi:MAG: sulfatase-like hydrolase/transferase [Holophagales bacterium]|nr:sulfatase-like hydrolase/transferase [Holophagales bacterium]